MAKVSKPKAQPKMIKHIVTQEDLDTNPDLVTQGVKVGDEIEIPEPSKLDEGASTALAEKMKPYIAAYPQNKTFYISTDGQVFLAAGKADAEAHQKFIDKDKELTPYEVN